MTKVFNILKKPCFWSKFGQFSQFWGQNFFLEYLALPCTTSYRFLASCQNLEKTHDIIPRKCPGRHGTEGRKDGRKDRQILFHRTLSANAGGPIYNNSIVLRVI